MGNEQNRVDSLDQRWRRGNIASAKRPDLRQPFCCGKKSAPADQGVPDWPSIYSVFLPNVSSAAPLTKNNLLKSLALPMRGKPLLSRNLPFSKAAHRRRFGGSSRRRDLKPRHAHYSSCFLLSYIRFAPPIRFITTISVMLGTNEFH